ncbi:CPBP family intramembrane glutamic endopeptidase [Chloroflexota bacterium]
MTWIRRHQLLSYFVFAYVITWAIWSPLVISAQGLANIQMPAWWHFFGAFGPLLSAFIVTGIVGGGTGIKELVDRILRWRIGFKWILVAFSPGFVFLISVVTLRLIEGVWLNIGQFGYVDELPQLTGLAGWVIWIVTFGLGEETGWRGFALPRLQKRYSALVATLILSVLWIIWHWPLFFYKEFYMTMNTVTTLIWLFGLVPLSIVFTWLYNSTRGSILMVILLHGTMCAATAAGIDPNIIMIVCVVGVVVSVLVVIFARPVNLSRVGKHTIDV